MLLMGKDVEAWTPTTTFIIEKDAYSNFVGTMVGTPDEQWPFTAVLARSHAGNRKEGEFSLLRIPLELAHLKSTRIYSCPPESVLLPLPPIMAEGIASTKGAEFLTIRPEKSPLLLKCDKRGLAAESIDAFRKLNGIHITKCITFDEQSFVAVGGREGNAVAIKLDTSGAIQWTREYDMGHHERFFDVCIGNNNDLYFTGISSAADNAFQVGPTQVWVLRCDSKGEKLSEEIFVGRRPRACILKQRTDILLAVAFDKSLEARASDYELVAFDGSLKRLWNEKWRQGDNLLEPCVLSANGDSIVGCQGSLSGLVVKQFTPAGKCVKAFEKREQNIIYTNARSAVSGQKALVSAQAMRPPNYDSDAALLMLFDLK